MTNQSDLVVLPRTKLEALGNAIEAIDGDLEAISGLNAAMEAHDALLAAAKPAITVDHCEIVGDVLVDGPQGRCRYARAEDSDTRMMMVPIGPGHRLLLIAADAAEEGE